jgi:hypothetical protein
LSQLKSSPTERKRLRLIHGSEATLLVISNLSEMNKIQNPRLVLVTASMVSLLNPGIQVTSILFFALGKVTYGAGIDFRQRLAGNSSAHFVM